MGASEFGISATTRSLPRTTERPVRKRGDEPRSNSVVIKRYVPYPTWLERGECSDLPVKAAPQSHGRKSVVRGLLKILFDLGTENNNTPVGISGHLSYYLNLARWVEKWSEKGWVTPL